MKISLKIFIFTYCLMMLITIFGGFLLIDYEYQDSLAQARQTALEENKTLYTYISMADEMLGDSSSAEFSLERFVSRMSDGNPNDVLLGEYENLEEQILLGSAERIESGQCIYSVITRDNQTKIQVTSRYKQRYMINYCNISDLIEKRDYNYQLYRNMIIVISVVIAAILYLFSWYITRPLVKVTKMAEKLSDGNYKARIDSSYQKMKSYEVERLGHTLNQLASSTEGYIEKLKEAAQKKEDFLGNFTHEIKTPMTSIIGYADLLRTYDLEPDKRREYSNYIYTEGKRIEQLAVHLLQLIVMDKTEFQMEQIRAESLFEQLEAEVRFLGEKHQMHICFDYELGMIWGEKSLLLVAIKNLIDNACKASKAGEDIFVQGRSADEGYKVQVMDRGHGIPKEEMGRILEPFYMVDKSRTRKQGGAGLGLSLCSTIMKIHDGEMRIESELDRGTTVTLHFKEWKNGGAENE